MLSCVFVCNLLRKRQHLFDLKLLDSFRCGSFYLLNIWLTMENDWVYQYLRIRGFWFSPLYL